MKVETLMRTTSASLAKHTGKTWDEWIALLESRSARHLSHQEIVALLKTKHKLTPWWQQIVATGFEQAIGRRVEGQNQKGLYAIASMKTVYVSDAKAWAFMTSEDGVHLWLAPMSPLLLKAGETFENAGFEGEGAFGEIRVVKPRAYIRFRWQDPEWEKPSTCVMMVNARDKSKCAIGFSHENLSNTRVKENARVYWKAAIERIAQALAVRK